MIMNAMFLFARYKMCLIEERKRIDAMKKELQQNQEEIEKLKEHLQEVQNQNHVKVRSLEVSI